MNRSWFTRTRQPPQTRLESLGTSHTWLVLILPSLAAMAILMVHPDCLNTVKVIPTSLSDSTHDAATAASSSRGFDSCPKPLSCWGGYRPSGEDISHSARTLDIGLAFDRPVMATKFMDIGLIYKAQVTHSNDGPFQPMKEQGDSQLAFTGGDHEGPATAAGSSAYNSTGKVSSPAELSASDLIVPVQSAAIQRRRLNTAQDMASSMLIHAKANITLFNKLSAHKLSAQHRAAQSNNSSSSWWSFFQNATAYEDVDELLGPTELFIESEVLFPDPVLDCLLTGFIGDHSSGVFKHKRRPNSDIGGNRVGNGNKTAFCSSIFSFDAIYSTFYRSGYITGRQLHYAAVDLTIGRELSLSSLGEKKVNDRPLKEAMLQYVDSAEPPPTITLSTQSQTYNLFFAVVYIVMFKCVCSLFVYSLFVLRKLACTARAAEVAAVAAARGAHNTTGTPSPATPSSSGSLLHHRRHSSVKTHWNMLEYLLPEQIYMVCILFTLLFWLNPISAALLIDAELHSLRFRRFFGSVLPDGLIVFLNLSESLAGVGLLFLFLVFIDGLKHTPEASEDDACANDHDDPRRNRMMMGLSSGASNSGGCYSNAAAVAPWLSTDYRVRRAGTYGASRYHSRGFGAPEWMQTNNDGAYATSARQRSQTLPTHHNSYLGEGTARLTPFIGSSGVTRATTAASTGGSILGKQTRRVFAIHHPLSPYFCDFIWKKSYLFLITALFQAVYCSLQFPQIFHYPWGSSPHQQVYVRVALHFIGCVISFLVGVWLLLIIRAFITTESHLRRIKYRTSRLRQMEFRLVLTQVIIGLLVGFVAACVHFRMWLSAHSTRLGGGGAAASFESLVFSHSGSISLAASITEEELRVPGTLYQSTATAVMNFFGLGGNNLINYGEASVWLMLKKVAIYALGLFGGAEGGPFLCRVFHGMQLAAPVFLVVLSLTAAFTLLPPRALPAILTSSLTQSSSAAGVQHRGEKDETHLELAVRDFEGTSHAFVVLERHMPYNDWTSADFGRIYHVTAVEKPFGRAMRVFRRSKRRIRELFCLETACWLMEASFQAYFPLIGSASRAAALAGTGAGATAMETNVAHELGFDYCKSAVPAPRSSTSSAAGISTTRGSVTKSTNPFDDDYTDDDEEEDEKKEEEGEGKEGKGKVTTSQGEDTGFGTGLGPQIDVQRLGLTLQSTFESTGNSTFGFIATASTPPLTTTASVPRAPSCLSAESNQLPPADTGTPSNAIDVTCIAEKIVVSFRGSVLANAATDMKFAQMSLPNMKYRRSYFIGIIDEMNQQLGRTTVKMTASKNSLSSSPAASSSVSSARRSSAIGMSFAPLAIRRDDENKPGRAPSSSSSSSPGVAFMPSCASSSDSELLPLSSSLHSHISGSSPSTFPSSVVEWLSPTQTISSNDTTPTSDTASDIPAEDTVPPRSPATAPATATATAAGRQGDSGGIGRSRAHSTGSQSSSSARLLQMGSEGLQAYGSSSDLQDQGYEHGSPHVLLGHSVEGDEEFSRAESGDSNRSLLVLPRHSLTDGPLAGVAHRARGRMSSASAQQRVVRPDVPRQQVTNTGGDRRNSSSSSRRAETEARNLHARTWVSRMRSCIDAVPLFRYALPRIHVGFWEAYVSVRTEFLKGIVASFCDHYKKLQRLYRLQKGRRLSSCSVAGTTTPVGGRVQPPSGLHNSLDSAAAAVGAINEDPTTNIRLKDAAASANELIQDEEIAKIIARPLRVYFCGHSLGGAMAVLASLDVAINMSSIEAAIIKVYGPLDTDTYQGQGREQHHQGSGSRRAENFSGFRLSRIIGRLSTPGTGTGTGSRSSYTPIPSSSHAEEREGTTTEAGRGRWSISQESTKKSSADTGGSGSGSSLGLVKEWTQPSLAVYTFGTPRIGNATFAALADRKLKSSYRVQVDNDIVTMVPKILGMYRHAGTPIVVDSEQAGTIIVKPTLVESHLWRPSRGALSSHYLSTYRACLEACFEDDELSEYLAKEHRLSSNNNISACSSRTNSFIGTNTNNTNAATERGGTAPHTHTRQRSYTVGMIPSAHSEH